MKNINNLLILGVLVISIFFGSVGIVGAETFTANLTIGSVGSEVADLQTWLENNGFLTMPTGVSKGSFGPLTRAALVKYQLSQGISPAVGYFGPSTRSKLNQSSVTKQTDSCESIKNSTFQSLIKYGGGLGPDGVFLTYSKVILQGNKFTWNHSDFAASGVYSCKNNILQVKFVNEPVVAVNYDANKKILNFDNHEYGLQAESSKDTLPDASVNVPYKQILTVENFVGRALYANSWEVISGGLPDGFYAVTLDQPCPADGACPLNKNQTYLRGTPTKVGTYNFTLKVSDGINFATKSFKLNVKKNSEMDTELKITPDTLPYAETNKHYSQVLAAEGFSGDMTWKISKGALPDGMGLEKNGVVCPAIFPSTCSPSETYEGFIGGQATKSGVYKFTVKASDGDKTLEQSYTLNVKKGFEISTNKKTYRKNEPIVITFKAFNETDIPKKFMVPASENCQVSYRINRAKTVGDNVYDSSSVSSCIADKTEIVIEPSESREWKLTHPTNELAKGSYEIYGDFTSVTHLQSIKITVKN